MESAWNPDGVQPDSEALAGARPVPSRPVRQDGSLSEAKGHFPRSEDVPSPLARRASSIRELELPTHRQLQALAHALLDAKPYLAAEPGDLSEALKWACARARWAYDGQRLARVTESVLFVRGRRRA